MRKIISLFQRNYDGDRKVRNEVTPGAEWVIEGFGLPTRKWDGTCCLIRDGKLYKRYDAKLFTIGPDGQRQEWNRNRLKDLNQRRKPILSPAINLDGYWCKQAIQPIVGMWRP